MTTETEIAQNERAAAPDITQHDVEAVNKSEHRSLYKKRVKIHPKRVWGTFRKLKWWIMAITLGIYYITPWIRWDRGIGNPDQAVLIDFPHRRFYFFFIEIWPQEVYYFAGLLIMAAVGLFFITSVFGRAWCGYACPQTVWTDLFIWVERFVEGDRAARIRLDKAPMSFSKAVKRVLKHTIWLVISVATGGAWIFYFADAPTLAQDFILLDAAPIAYMTVGVLTFTTYSLGGLMREQVCTYMCPWPRIQGAMMDEHSLTVTYKHDRGEPRAPYKKGETFENRGDCVDCKACVVACPAGIDIRDGQQLECITCALCIDACDDVMSKIGRPRGLIDYDSVAAMNARIEGKPAKLRPIRFRTVAYFSLWAAIGIFMLVVFVGRTELDINVLRDRNPIFTRLGDGSIQNAYTFKILNKARIERSVFLEITEPEGARMKVVGAAETEPAMTALFELNPDTLQSFRLLVQIPDDMINDEAMDIHFQLRDMSNGETATYDSVFRAPER
ncbi:MAG: cytochrome c oxidase accessory protein CcoG [Rhodospirillales bacterium]|nr:cytochrome c oxidase accessory protein CcoG [Rhodospirillales bacterium]MBO6788461.1 cytochrome c oxidase accessory protein CcoG [Rhodospirillales bacterium]